VPDFVANRMGIVNCANEMYGYVNNDPHFNNHLGETWEQSVYATVLRMLNVCGSEKKAKSQIEWSVENLSLPFLSFLLTCVWSLLLVLFS
jgi:hypothetical protein